MQPDPSWSPAQIFSGGYAIALGPGHGSIPTRRMASGDAIFQYQVYATAARTTVWGDGTGGSMIVSGGGSFTCNQAYSVYGRGSSRGSTRTPAPTSTRSP
ncbi:spore coat protein U domain-containing protein [Plastoroseomonas hellenica]